MNKNLKVTVLSLIALSVMAGGIPPNGKFIPGVEAAEKDSTEAEDLRDHGGVFVMNPQTRGGSDLVRTVDNVAMNIDTTDLPIDACSGRTFSR